MPKKIIERKILFTRIDNSISLDLQPYEVQMIISEFDKGKFPFFEGISVSSTNVSNAQRGFFFGYVFEWAANLIIENLGFIPNVSKKTLGRAFLMQILKQEMQKLNVFGIEFSVPIEELSFSKSVGTNEKLQQAIDIWTSFFGENGIEFPQPDKNFKLNKLDNGKIDIFDL